jgi:hypothetical protein
MRQGCGWSSKTKCVSWKFISARNQGGLPNPTTYNVGDWFPLPTLSGYGSDQGESWGGVGSVGASPRGLSQPWKVAGLPRGLI